MVEAGQDDRKHHQSLSQLAYIDNACDQFESAWQSAERPAIEDYLTHCTAPRRPELFRSLLDLDVDYRRRAGESPSIEEYCDRFPEYDQIIHRGWESANAVAADCYQAGDGSAGIRDESRSHGLEDNANMSVTYASPVLEAGDHPQRIGRYLVERNLGQGGFGVVYLAHDPDLDRSVALKVPREKRFQTPQQLASFIQEVRTAAKLKHPLLVAVYDVQEQNGLPYIVQEYIDGQSLSAWAAQHQPSFDRIAQILVGVAEALGYAHEQGLTHCDLKLANVLMDAQGQPHVADFGLAIHESSQALRKGEVFGTPAMMAPSRYVASHTSWTGAPIYGPWE